MFAGQEIGPTNFIRPLSGPIFCLAVSLSDEIAGTLGFFPFFSFKILKLLINRYALRVAGYGVRIAGYAIQVRGYRV